MVLFYITLLKWTLYVLSSFYFRKQYYNEYILDEDSDLGLCFINKFWKGKLRGSGTHAFLSSFFFFWTDSALPSECMKIHYFFFKYLAQLW